MLDSSTFVEQVLSHILSLRCRRTRNLLPVLSPDLLPDPGRLLDLGPKAVQDHAPENAATAPGLGPGHTVGKGVTQESTQITAVSVATTEDSGDRTTTAGVTAAFTREGGTNEGVATTVGTGPTTGTVGRTISTIISTAPEEGALAPGPVPGADPEALPRPGPAGPPPLPPPPGPALRPDALVRPSTPARM